MFTFNKFFVILCVKVQKSCLCVLVFVYLCCRFTGSIKLKGVVLIGGEDEYHPRELRLFKNRPALGFDDIQGEPDQLIQLSRDSTGTLEYPVK